MTFGVLFVMSAPGAQAPASWIEEHRSAAERLIRESTGDQFAWNRLAELTDTYGSRLSGSENLQRAIAWAVETMKQDGLENVHTEKVMVPRWVRGAESAGDRRSAASIRWRCSASAAASPRRPAGLEADVLVVKSFDELEAARGRGERARSSSSTSPYTNYGQTVQYRTGGASAAARTARSRCSSARSGRWACARRTPAA